MLLNTATPTEYTPGPCELNNPCGVGECVAVDDGSHRCRCPHGYSETSSYYGVTCERK